MAEYLIQDTSLEAIADAINAKTGGSSAMTPAEMVTAIGSISGGGGGGGGVEVTLVGETPLMNSSNNTSIDGICTFDVDGVSFNAFLFISKDRTAFKWIWYFEDSISASTSNGIFVYGNYGKSLTAGYSSFVIAARADASTTTLTVNHGRVTGNASNFYSIKPQKFDIFAVKVDPALLVAGV